MLDIKEYNLFHTNLSKNLPLLLRLKEQGKLKDEQITCEFEPNEAYVHSIKVKDVLEQGAGYEDFQFEEMRDDFVKLRILLGFTKMLTPFKRKERILSEGDQNVYVINFYHTDHPRENAAESYHVYENGTVESSVGEPLGAGMTEEVYEFIDESVKLLKSEKLTLIERAVNMFENRIKNNQPHCLLELLEAVPSQDLKTALIDEKSEENNS